MILPVRLERVEAQAREQNKDEWVIYELEKDAKIRIIKKEERAPTLTELLFNQTEEEIMTLTDFLDQGNE